MKSAFFVAALAAVVQAESNETEKPNWAEKIWNDATAAVTCAACEVGSLVPLGRETG